MYVLFRLNENEGEHILTQQNALAVPVRIQHKHLHRVAQIKKIDFTGRQVMRAEKQSGLVLSRD